MKKTVGFILSAALIFSLEIPVQAETFYGDEGWRVVFTEEKEMESTFRTSDLNDVIAGMQPGDRVIFSLGLSNENAAETDWYMTPGAARPSARQEQGFTRRPTPCRIIFIWIR